MVPNPQSPINKKEDRASYRHLGINLSRTGLIIGLVAILVTLLCIIILAPSVYIRGDVSVSQERLLKAQNDLRATLLQAFGGIFFIVTAFLGWRQLVISRNQLEVNIEQLRSNQEQIREAIAAGQQQLKIAEETLVTERFSQAIAHLGSEMLDLRLGGIYALDRLAQYSELSRDTVNEILLAYVRSHSPWPPGIVETQEQERSMDLLVPSMLPPLRVRAPDVQAIVTILSRQGNDGKPAMLDLGGVDLRTADLTGARLNGADLSGAHLECATMYSAHLKGTLLRGTSLEEADLTASHLEGADLSIARLSGAILQHANLQGSRLASTDLRGVDLTEVRLENAIANDQTKWPDAFDWRAARVILGDDSEIEPGENYARIGLTTSIEGQWLVFHFDDVQLDVYTAPGIREAFISAVSRGYYHFILDITNIAFLDSTGLGVFTGALKRVRNHGGSISIRCSEPKVLRIFRITGLSKVFPVVP